MSGGVSSALRMAGTLGKHSSLHAMATADAEVSNDPIRSNRERVLHRS